MVAPVMFVVFVRNLPVQRDLWSGRYKLSLAKVFAPETCVTECYILGGARIFCPLPPPDVRRRDPFPLSCVGASAGRYVLSVISADVCEWLDGCIMVSVIVWRRWSGWRLVYGAVYWC